MVCFVGSVQIDPFVCSIFSDNVIPCVLRHMGVLKLDKALADKIDAAKFLHSGDDEVEGSFFVKG